MELDSYRNFLTVWINRKLRDQEIPRNLTGCRLSCNGVASVAVNYTPNQDSNKALAVEAFMQLVPMEYFDSWSISDFNDFFKVEFFKSY